MVRLLFTLPPLVMFGSVLAVRAFAPPLLAPTLALAMAGLTLWSAFEASSDLYGTTEPGDWLEVLLTGVTVVGLVGYLWASQQAGRRVAGRAHEAATRSPGSQTARGSSAFTPGWGRTRRSFWRCST